MGYVEVEQFALARGIDDAEFARRDGALQAWAYVHRRGLVRRTTARGDGGEVLVVSVFQGAAAPLPASPDTEGADALASFSEAIDDPSYRRSVYRDLD